MRFLIVLMLLLLLPAVAFAQQADPTAVFKAYAGANAVWYDGATTLPNDFELGGSVRASLSSHISMVGGAYFGLQEEYLRAAVGPRFTVSDVMNPNFSMGLGIQYQFSSKGDLRPQEWCPEVSIGWVPWPETMPGVVLGGQGAYGLETNLVAAQLSVRYFLGSF